MVIGLIMLLWYPFEKSNFMLYGAITYLVISQILRRTISKEHRRGMANIQRQQFEEAIANFERSYAFFQQNNWIDQYRFVTLLSSGRMSYKEMALNNIAFCYGQLGNGLLSKEYYQKTLDEFPESEMAKVGLRFLQSMNQDGAS